MMFNYAAKKNTEKYDVASLDYEQRKRERVSALKTKRSVEINLNVMVMHRNVA